MATEDELLSRTDKIKKTLRSTADAVTLGPQRRFALDYAKNRANEAATNREDRREFKNKTKRKAATEARLNAAPEPIAQTNPKPVTLANAKPSVMESTINLDVNPNFNPDTDAPVTRNTESGQFEDQATRNENKRRINRTTTVQPDKLPSRNPVEVVRGGTGPNAGETTTLHSGVDSSTISDADLKVQDKIRNSKIPNAGQAREILDNVKAHSPAQVREAVKIAAGETAALGGEVAGNVVKNAGEGFNAEFTDAEAVNSEKPLDVEGRNINDVASEQRTMRSIIDDPKMTGAQKAKAIEELTVSLRDANIVPTEDTVLKGPASEAGTAEAQKAAASAAEDARLQSIADNKDYTKAQRTAAREAIAEKAGVPKAQRNAFQKTGDAIGNTLKNALPESIGGNPVATDSSGNRPAGPKGKVGGAIKGVGTLGTADIVGQIGKAFALHDGDAPGVMADAVSDFVDHATTQFRTGQGTEFVKELADALIRSPASIISAFSDVGARIGGEQLKFISNGLEQLGVPREFIPEVFLPSQVTGENADFAASLRDINEPDYQPTTISGRIIKSFDGATPDALRLSGRDQQNPSLQERPRQEQQPTDAAGQPAVTGQGGQGGQGAPAAGLRQPYVPPGQSNVSNNISQAEYEANNANTNSIARGLAPGTGFMQSNTREGPANSNNTYRSTFIDGRNQPEPQPQQERGLGAAQNAITRGGNGRFNQTDPMANFVGEFARARSSYDQQALEQTERKNQATLSSAAGTAASTAATARNTAEATRFKDISDGLNSGDETTIRNTKTSVFGGFQNQINQGNYDPNSANARQAANIITRSVVDQGDVGLPRAIWNSLAPALLGGGGRGALDLLNGDPSLNNGIPFTDIMFDNDGTLLARSSDAQTGLVNLGFIDDADTANFLRQILSLHEQKGQ